MTKRGTHESNGETKAVCKICGAGMQVKKLVDGMCPRCKKDEVFL